MSARHNLTVLTSWKEIAAYFGKGVRTVQRWERELGLPVRRPSGNSHDVYAQCEELQAWLASWPQRRRPNPENPIPGNGSSRPENCKLLDFRAKIRLAGELRKRQRQLLGDLRQSVSDLAETCQVTDMRITKLVATRKGSPENTDPGVSK
jgi:hypothetical protein